MVTASFEEVGNVRHCCESNRCTTLHWLAGLPARAALNQTTGQTAWEKRSETAGCLNLCPLHGSRSMKVVLHLRFTLHYCLKWRQVVAGEGVAMSTAPFGGFECDVDGRFSSIPTSWESMPPCNRIPLFGIPRIVARPYIYIRNGYQLNPAMRITDFQMDGNTWKARQGECTREDNWGDSKVVIASGL